MGKSTEGSCHAPGVESKCHSKVMNAMLAGFEKRPDDFPGLNTRSNYRDFQAFFWNNGMHSCPRPCMAQEEPCVPFDEAYPCRNDVAWAAEHGLEENPEWYPELRQGADWKDIALVLYVHGQPGCPRPCDKDEPKGHYVPYDPDKEEKDNFKDDEESKEFEEVPDKGSEHSHEDSGEDEEQTPEEDVARLENLIQTQKDRSQIKKVQVEMDDCARPGIAYHPTIVESPRNFKSSNECRVHCRTWPGAGYFTFYAPLSVCHCSPYGATKEEVADMNNLAGALDCGATWEEINKDTARIVRVVDDGCFKMNIGFGPMVGEDAPVKVKDALQCHRKLLQSGVAAAQHFAYDTRNGMCRIVAPGAQEMQMLGFMSGPKSCKEESNMLEFKAEVHQGQAVATSVPTKLMRILSIPTAVMCLLLVAAGAGTWLRIRRRGKLLVLSQGRTLTRSTDLEGLEEPCIVE